MIKEKKILYLSFGMLPFNTGNGNSVLMYSVIKCMQKLSFSVEVLPIDVKPIEDGYEDKKQFLISEGIYVKEISNLLNIAPKNNNKLNTIRRIISPKKGDYMIDGAYIRRIQNYINAEKIDIVIAYNWQGVMVLSELQCGHRIASIVDLLDDLMSVRWRNILNISLNKRFRFFMNQLLARKQAYFGYQALSKIDLTLEHASQHAEKLIAKGFENIHYIPHPLTEQLELGRLKTKTTLVRVLMLGSLKGAASALGFEYLLNEVLPILEDRSKDIEIDYEIRIVGHGTMPDHIKKRVLTSSNIRFIGFVKNVSDEFRSSDIMLVTIPVAHGFRTRIAEAFSYGMCVVTHAANAKGMPEIRDGENALSASEANQFTDNLINAINSPLVRERLGQDALRTFKEEISMDSALCKLKKILLQDGISLPLN